MESLISIYFVQPPCSFHFLKGKALTIEPFRLQESRSPFWYKVEVVSNYMNIYKLFQALFGVDIHIDISNKQTYEQDSICLFFLIK